jgi:hypothetical protein
VPVAVPVAVLPTLWIVITGAHPGKGVGGGGSIIAWVTGASANASAATVAINMLFWFFISFVFLSLFWPSLTSRH